VPPTPEAQTAAAAALARALRGLPVEIEEISVETSAVAIPSYPGGSRPSATVTLHGRGARGQGEHVGWTAEEHSAFARRVRALTLPRRGARRLGDLASELPGVLEAPYDRAAIEAAAIDLALRQANLSLAALLDATPHPVRYVVSFEATGDPLARLHDEVGDTPGLGVKVDVDPAWTDATFAALAATGRVAVLDWKRGGASADHERARRLVPEALQEDPGPTPSPCAAVADRLSFDGIFTHARALEELPIRPLAANVKPARMGGVLEALDGIASCMASGISVYLGGMFEVGVGRRQLRDLAALLCPDAPNDIAPIDALEAGAARPPRPVRLSPAGRSGFGGSPRSPKPCADPVR
jgi:hypothetical protein